MMVSDYLKRFKRTWYSPVPAVGFSDMVSAGWNLLLLFSVFYFAVFSFNVPGENICHGLIEFTIVAFSAGCGWLILCTMAELYKKVLKRNPFPTVGCSILKFLIFYSLIMGILYLIKPIVFELEKGWIWPYYWRHFPYAFLIFAVYFYHEIKSGLLKGLSTALNQRPENSGKKAPGACDETGARPVRVQVDGQTRMMSPLRISHISVNGHYLDIFYRTDGGTDRLFVRKPLSAFFEELPTPPFLRIHRSHIVNLNYVSDIKKVKRRYFAVLCDAQSAVPVSRRNLPVLLSHVQE